MKHLTLILTLLMFSVTSFAQEEEKESTDKKKWYENFSIKGYFQIRYNGLYESNPNLSCDQCDKEWGNGSSLSLRRARLVFSGQVHPRIYFYFQPDFASSFNDEKMYFGQIRDAFFDLGIDKENVYRIRIGQSKVPSSFENLQSSGSRLTLDRNDATNSTFVNERDLGVYFMWSPKSKKELFKKIVDDGLKGTGDFGMFAFGFSNGQPTNTRELNKNKHIITRFAYPFYIKDQIFEAGVWAYSGVYQMMGKDISQGVKYNPTKEYLDQRAGAHFVWYPKPFGIQAEYNIGKGPQYNVVTDSIETRNLHGGYILANYQVKIKKQLLIPFVKYHYYDGGKKYERDARSYIVNEVNAGLEWQPFKNFELVAQYSYSDRTYIDHQKQDNRQFGHSIRIQAQVNF